MRPVTSPGFSSEPLDVRHARGIRLRRALTLLAMTLVLPGSAQLVSGSKRVGRISLRIWGVLWLLAVAVVVMGLTNRTLIFDRPEMIDLADQNGIVVLVQ